MYTNPASVKNWRRLCRLCARHDGHSFDICVEQGLQDSKINLHSAIEEYFHINIKPKDEMPPLLCTECCSAIESLENYSQLIKKVQIMYEDLKKTAVSGEIDLNELHAKYGLFKCETFKSPASCIMETSSTTSYVEQIFVSDAPVTIVKDEEMERSSKTPEKEVEVKMEFSDPLTNLTNDVEDCTRMSEHSDSSCRSSISDECKNDTKTNYFIDSDPKQSIYICAFCKQSFPDSRKYSCHMRLKHSSETPLWNCPHCTQSLKYKKELDRHIKKMHAPSVYPCTQCDRKFKRAKDAENHVKAEHEFARSFVCEECGERVRTNKKLIEHMAVHTGQGAYECKECGKHYARKMCLKRHMEVHGDRHICGECGLKLNTSLALKSHMKVHSDEMPYKCNYCGRRFKRTKNLKNHLITHTGLKPYSCDFCDKTFSTGSSCRYHKKHLHPKELAALEAAGVKTYTKNIPKLHVLQAITQAAGEVEKYEINVSDKRMKLPKLDAELPDT